MSCLQPCLAAVQGVRGFKGLPWKMTADSDMCDAQNNSYVRLGHPSSSGWIWILTNKKVDEVIHSYTTFDSV